LVAFIGLVACAGVGDCGAGNGMICALNTCCPASSVGKPGVCLSGECVNPSQVLRRLVREREGESRWVDTAAWVGLH
jgi:hypothetical protein